MRIVILVALFAVAAYARPQVRAGGEYGTNVGNGNGNGQGNGNGNGYGGNPGTGTGNGNGNGYGGNPGNSGAPGAPGNGNGNGNGYGGNPGTGNGNGNGYGGNTGYVAPSNPYGDFFKQMMAQVQTAVASVDVTQQQVEQFSQMALKGVQNAVKIFQAYQGGSLNMGFLQTLISGGAGAVAPASINVGAAQPGAAQALQPAETNYDGYY